jgi:hypothetical protein
MSLGQLGTATSTFGGVGTGAQASSRYSIYVSISTTGY